MNLQNRIALSIKRLGVFRPLPFAVGQAIAAYVYAAMYAAFLEYTPVFQLATAIALLALIINLFSAHWQNRPSP